MNLKCLVNELQALAEKTSGLWLAIETVARNCDLSDSGLNVFERGISQSLECIKKDIEEIQKELTK